MTYKGNRLVSELTNESSIEAWRAAKAKADDASDPKALLGCVGEPIADWLDKYIDLDRYSDDCIRDLSAACAEARGNLLDMVNDKRQEIADDIQGELHSTLEYLDAGDIEHEIDIDDTLRSAADKAFSHAAYVAGNVCFNVEIEDGDL